VLGVFGWWGGLCMLPAEPRPSTLQALLGILDTPEW